MTEQREPTEREFLEGLRYEDKFPDRTLLAELENFARYSESVASESVGLGRLTWQERTEWASRLAAQAKAMEAELERVKADLHQVHLNYHHMVDVAHRLRAGLRQADLRLEQVSRDRRERDKVFATTTTARAEIARALDEEDAR